MLLLQNQTANTDGSQSSFPCSGGNILVQADGTFDGAAVTIQGSMQGFDFQDMTDETGAVVSIIEGTILVINFCKPGLLIRASLTGAGAGTDVSIGIL